MGKPPLKQPDPRYTAVLCILWAVSSASVVGLFYLSISAASFFGGTIVDGLRLAFEAQPWWAFLSLSSLAAVALIHWRLRKR